MRGAWAKFGPFGAAASSSLALVRADAAVPLASKGSLYAVVLVEGGGASGRRVTGSAAHRADCTPTVSTAAQFEPQKRTHTHVTNMRASLLRSLH